MFLRRSRLVKVRTYVLTLNTAVNVCLDWKRDATCVGLITAEASKLVSRPKNI